MFCPDRGSNCLQKFISGRQKSLLARKELYLLSFHKVWVLKRVYFNYKHY